MAFPVDVVTLLLAQATTPLPREAEISIVENNTVQAGGVRRADGGRGVKFEGRATG